MRIIGVLLALVAVPLMASTAQGQTNRGQGHNDQHCAMRAAKHSGKEINKCEAPAPLPPPAAGCTVTPPSNAGNLSIEGQVFLDVDPWPGLAGWCVVLTGPVNATAMTDASGSYSFTGLPDGTYTVCEVLPSGWQQTFPTDGAACSNGAFGWSFELVGYSAGLVSFFNSQTP
jgi:SdrD B-like protein